MRDNTTKTIHKQDIIKQLDEGGIYDNNGNNFGPEYWNQENAIDLLNILPNKVICIENKKDKLYNVLMNKYTTIMVNNMEVETLDPNNPVAKLYN